MVGGTAWVGHAAQQSALAVGSLDIRTARRRNARRWKKDSDAPLPGAPNVGFRVPADPQGSKSGVHAEIAPPTYLRLDTLQGSKLHEDQHTVHEVYTSSGHHCGVIPYSSLWRGGLPQGLVMNNTKEELPRKGRSSCGGDASRERLNLDPFLLWWLDLFIDRGAGPPPKY